MKPTETALTPLLLVLVMLASGPLLFPLQADHDEPRCFVQYAPDKVRDFSDFLMVKHRDGSKVASYLMRSGEAYPERYDSADQAEHWIQEVYRQLRQCSG